LLLLGTSGTAGAIIAAARGDVPLHRRAVLLLVALAVIVPIAITVATRPAMYNGIRHFVFITPPLAVLGGIAGAWIITRLCQTWRPAGVFAALAFAAASLLPILDMVKLHPYQYAYFNWVAGGVRAADDLYMLDYWGLAFKQATQELRQKLGQQHEVPTAHKRWRMAVCGPQRPAQVELGPDFVISWDPTGADFAMTLGEFYCAKLAAPVMVEIVRDGVVFARVYDIRGKSFTSLLALPAP
jgi:hypothetical protein